MNFNEYNLVYLNVKCTGVDWTNRPYPLFKFSYKDKDFIFMQIRYISQSADTDHIRVVIEYQFIPFLLAQNKDKEELIDYILNLQ